MEVEENYNKDTENCTKKFGRCFAKISIGFKGEISWFILEEFKC